jgi:hypothetical protein
VRHASGSGTDVDAFTESLKSQLAKAVLQELTPEKLKHHFDLSSTSMHIQPEGEDIVSQVNAMSLEAEEIFYNSSPAVLYQEALQEKGSAIVSSGALAVSSHAKTGRSPLDKRIVDEPSSTKDVWWGKVNIPLSTSSFMTNRERALDYLNTREKLYVIDGFVGWIQNSACLCELSPLVLTTLCSCRTCWCHPRRASLPNFQILPSRHLSSTTPELSHAIARLLV